MEGGDRSARLKLRWGLGSVVAFSLLLGACGGDQNPSSSRTPVVSNDSGDTANSGSEEVGAGVVLLRQGFTVIAPENEPFPLPHVSAAVELQAPAGSGWHSYRVTFSFHDEEDGFLGSEDTYAIIEAGKTGYAKINYAELDAEPASFSVRAEARDDTSIAQVTPLEVTRISKSRDGDASLVSVSMDGAGDPEAMREVQCVAFVDGEPPGGYTEIDGGPGPAWNVELPFVADAAFCWAQLYETASPKTASTTTATTTTTTVPSTTTTAPPGITLAQYEQLYLGMPESELWAIITAPCRLEAESQTPAFEINGEVVIEALHGKQYVCETASGIVSIGIQNGEVSFLSQYGLR